MRIHISTPNKLFSNIILLLAALLFLSTSCSEPILPQAPDGFASNGTIGSISLSWNRISGVLGYTIYRSTDGTSFTSLYSGSGTSYTNTLSTSDKNLYYYYLTAYNEDAESLPSATVRDMQGERLDPSYAADCIIGAGEWYVADGTVSIPNGNLEIDSNGELYVLDGAAIKVKAGDRDDPDLADQPGKFIVNGLLRVLADPSNPATITTVTDSPPDENGFSLMLVGAVDYGTGSGTIIQNCYLTNLHIGDGAVHISSCSPKFYNVKLYGNESNGRSYFDMFSGAIVEHCSFQNIVPTVMADMRSTDFSFRYNTQRNGFYSFYVFSSSGFALSSGQVSQNDFDGSKEIYLHNMDGGTDVPLENNYWGGGTGSPPEPSVIQGGTTSVTVDYSPVLSEAPSDVGPNW